MSDDMINHPPHYKLGDHEVIGITEQLDFLSGNVVKYVCRAGRKEGVRPLDDLLKARWYLDRLIAWGASDPTTELERAQAELKCLTECLVEATDVVRRLALKNYNTANKENNTDE